jgi:hypothetical protein
MDPHMTSKPSALSVTEGRHDRVITIERKICNDGTDTVTVHIGWLAATVSFAEWSRALASANVFKQA